MLATAQGQPHSVVICIGTTSRLERELARVALTNP